MLSLLPGMGLGFTGSKEIAFGLGAMVVTEIPVPITPTTPGGSGKRTVSVLDNAYSRRGSDDDEIMDILHILLGVIDE